MKNPQELLMTAVADSLPTPMLAKQVKMAIDEYLEEQSEHNLGFVIFVMQMFLMKHIMEKKNINADELMKDINKHANIMDLFNENNN